MQNLINALIAARQAVEIKQRLQAPQRRRQVCEHLHLKQVSQTETDLQQSLKSLFVKQVRAVASRLQAMAGEGKTDKSYQAPDASSQALAEQVFQPEEWNNELVTRVMPPLARAMANAMWAQLRVMGVDTRKFRKVPSETKASTASEFLQENFGGVFPDQLGFNTPYGPVTLGVAAEVPDWMLESISAHLEESFSQDYWANINHSTLTDVEKFLRQGLSQGWSIDRMAEEIAKGISGSEDYAQMRAERIARTESGNALNSARSQAIDSFLDEMTGQDLPMRKVWMSVLGNTTRDSHANIDGVPADSKGEWRLGDVRCRWPGDIMLPVGERANCQCSIYLDMGMTDEIARELIADYESRLTRFGFGRKSTGQRFFV